MRIPPVVNKISLFAVFSLFILPATAHAFDTKGIQPLSPYGIFSTFSAESLPQNGIGLGLGLERSVEPQFHRATLQAAWGIHDRVELNATLPYILGLEDQPDGAEDISLGLKHRIFDETSYTPAVAYMLTVSLPSGRDVYSTDGSFGAGLLVTKKVGPFKGHLNLLYSNPQKADLHDEYTLNLGAELAVSHSSRILAELVGRQNYFTKRIDLIEWRLGYRLATTENVYTSLGVGFDIKERAPEYRFLFTVGVILPPGKKDVRRYEDPSPVFEPAP